jgi:hypothetical protein
MRGDLSSPGALIQLMHIVVFVYYIMKACTLPPSKKDFDSSFGGRGGRAGGRAGGDGGSRKCWW